MEATYKPSFPKVFLNPLDKKENGNFVQYFRHMSNSKWAEKIKLPKLKPTAAILLQNILDTYNGWDFSITNMCERVNVGQKALRSAIRQIVLCGYLKIIRYQDQNTGRFLGTGYYVSEIAEFQKENESLVDKKTICHYQIITSEAFENSLSSPSGKKGNYPQGNYQKGSTNNINKNNSNKTNTNNNTEKTKGSFTALKESLQTVKNAVCSFNKKLDKEQEELLNILKLVPGMNPDIAENLVRKYSIEEIKLQLEYLPFRKILESQGKTLANSITGKWSAPAGYVKQEENQKSQENKIKETETWLPVLEIWDKNFYNQSTYGRGEVFIDAVSARRIITHKIKELWKKYLNNPEDYCYSVAEKINKTTELMNIYDVTDMNPGELEPLLEIASEYEVL